jgi:thiamine-monophosphate kinase
MSEQKKDISQLGEFGLIDLITKDIKLKNETSVFGVGDDAAVLDYKNKKTILTTDILTEGVHFDLMYNPLKHLGYKAVVVNLSDVYAMNANPQQIVVSIAVSAKFTAEMIEELYEGIKLACEFYKVDLVGGDTTSSLSGLIISIAALGYADEEKITYRNGAQENDLICVSGDLGGAFMGLQLLEREKKVFTESKGGQPDLTGFEYVLERQLKPEARYDIVDELNEKGIQPTSMIDISDGLSSELLHLTTNSNKGCKVHLDKIPVSQELKEAADEFQLEPTTIALNGGEDYELLFTVSLSDFDKVKDWDKVSVIGHITSESDGKHLVTPDGSLVELSSMGWDGLKSEELT